METTVKERLVTYLKHKKLGQNKFEKQAGLSVGHISKIKIAPRPMVLDKILAAAPDLNKVWLLTGEGEMIVEPKKADEAVIVAPQVYMAPLISKYAYAGVTAGWGDDDNMDSLPKYPMFVDHDPHGQYYAIEVKGDSMDDGTDRSIKDGSIALCRVVPPELYRDSHLHIHRWVFVIVTNDGILIKKIEEHNLEAGTLTLESYNNMYQDTTISLADVKCIMNVVSVTRTM